MIIEFLSYGIKLGAGGAVVQLGNTAGSSGRCGSTDERMMTHWSGVKRPANPGSNPGGPTSSKSITGRSPLERPAPEFFSTYSCPGLQQVVVSECLVE